MRSRAFDTLLFWAVVIVLCITAWAFWHFLGPAADVVLIAILLVGFLLDYRRKRRSRG